MNIYIKNLKTKELLRLPMLPTEVTGTIENKMLSYSIIDRGDVEIPIGTSLDTYSWSAMFPGKHRKNDPYIRAYTPPKMCDNFMRALKTKNGKPVKAKLMITKTHVNLDVYLQSYSPTESGGYGDISYSVTFIRAKDLKVKEVSEKKASDKSGTGKKKTELKNKPAGKSEARTSPPKAKTYTVKSGDCLWKIAQKFYGKGSDYTKIYQANKKEIGSNPNLIYPGQVFKIP